MDSTNMHPDIRYVSFAYAVAISVGAIALVTLPYPPLYNALIADLIATVVIFGFSYHFRNSSAYDAYWSVIPRC